MAGGTPTIYDWAGGRAGFERWQNRFCDLVEPDDLLRHPGAARRRPRLRVDPHGTYARDLRHVVELLGFTSMEAILSAAALGGEIVLRPDELGKVQPGYPADLLLVDGDPLAGSPSCRTTTS